MSAPRARSKLSASARTANANANSNAARPRAQTARQAPTEQEPTPPKPVERHEPATTTLPHQVSDRHREVLHAALELMSERGFAGASLRELARKLNVQQPSLYTYFASKDELLAQVIEVIGTEILYGHPPDDVPHKLDDVPRWTVELVVRLYDVPTYRTFLRLLFTVGVEHEAARQAMRRLYTDGFTFASQIVMQPFVDAGEISPTDAEQLMRMITHAIGLSLIEHRVLYGEPETPDAVREYTAWVIAFVTDSLPMLRNRRHSRAARGT